MILSAVKVLELNNKHNLVQDLCDRELNNPEGCGFDLRVGRVERIKGDSFLGADKEDSKNRYSPVTELLGDIETEGNKEIIMKPGDYLLVQTIETISSPNNLVLIDEKIGEKYLMPLVFPRSSLQRGGVSFHATKTDPGYTGKLTFGIKNLGEYDFRFELGARMFNVVFHVVNGDMKRTYSGQHQGGRITSQGAVEEQN